MVAQEYIDAGSPISKVLDHAGLSRSTYYYKPGNGKRGRRSSTHTLHKDGYLVSNTEVVEAIIWLLSQEFVDYGYVKVTKWLQRRGLIINKKKVLALMRMHRLLLPKPQRTRTGKTWVKDLLPITQQPFDYLEFDIKYVRIDHIGRNAMMLTVLDVLSRFNMGFLLQYSMHKEDVTVLFDEIFSRYPLPTHVTVRSDNGSQFESHHVRDYFEGRAIVHEFTKPATPEQNAHIEAYHSIYQRAVCDRIYFESLKHAQQCTERFAQFYNFERLHSGIGYNTPAETLRLMHVAVNEPTEETMKTPQFFSYQLQEFLS